MAGTAPAETSRTVRGANKLSSIADGELPRGTRVDPRSPYAGDINRITTSSCKKQSPLFTRFELPFARPRNNRV